VETQNPNTTSCRKTKAAFKRAVDVWEFNEAFAAQSLGVLRELGMDSEEFGLTRPLGIWVSFFFRVGYEGV